MNKIVMIMISFGLFALILFIGAITFFIVFKDKNDNNISIQTELSEGDSKVLTDIDRSDIKSAISDPQQNDFKITGEFELSLKDNYIASQTEIKFIDKTAEIKLISGEEVALLIIENEEILLTDELGSDWYELPISGENSFLPMNLKDLRNIDITDSDFEEIVFIGNQEHKDYQAKVYRYENNNNKVNFFIYDQKFVYVEAEIEQGKFKFDIETMDLSKTSIGEVQSAGIFTGFAIIGILDPFIDGNIFSLL